MIRRVDQLGNEWLTEYDDRGNAVRFVGPDGATVEYTFDGIQLPSSVTDQEGQTTRFEYLDNGQPRRIIDHLGNELRFEYDARGQLVRHIDREGGVTEWAYDNAGRVAAVTEGGPDNPGTVSFTYDELGNPLTITQPGGGVTRMTYDEVGNLTTMTDPLSHVTEWEYELNGRLVVQTPADGNATTMVYDEGGRLESATDILGLTAHHLIEQRFATQLGGNTDDWPSIVVTRAEHNQFTQAWREQIPYGDGTRNATRAEIEAAAREIYADYPEILEALGL